MLRISPPPAKRYANSILPEQLVVDFSHGNCQKQHRRQLEVCANICQQIREGSTAIAGIMAESFLAEGTQKVIPVSR
ncbi:2-keto-3-deoxy-D-arabino-heptulosonate-7-phosphate synthase I alpha [Klebsiella aerogenes]|nr:2-keto-3-deoxy-D-arabino-heptulosonate-7-phosphate synthase I alpha [Klebsiella aerogenes]